MLLTGLIGVANAATYTTQNLGTIKPGTSFQNTHTNEYFNDVYQLTIEPNFGVGAAAININFDGSSRTKFEYAALDNGVTTYHMNINNNSLTNTIWGVWDNLPAGSYTMLVNGIASAGTSSYTGNWTVINDTGNVPIPGAIWLFGCGLTLVFGIARGKK